MSSQGASASAHETSSTKYVCTSIIIDGLPARGFFKTEGKYFLRVTLDGGKEWESREIQTKASRVAWDEDQDNHALDCPTTSVVRVSLWKRHPSRPEEEVGSAERTVQAWLESTKPSGLVFPSAQKIKTSIVVSVRLKQVSAEPSPVTPLDDMQKTIDQADSDASQLRNLPGLDTVQAGIDVVNRAKAPAMEIEDIWEPLLQDVDWFMDVMDVVTEVHPYAKTAWAVLSAAYKAVRAQQARDGQVMDLVSKMKEIYEFVREARQLDEIKNHPGTDTLREKALVRLSTQTIECGHFISTYAKDRNFLTRLLKQTTTSKGDAISKYMDSFQKIKDAFWEGSALSIELVTFRMMGKLESLESKTDVEKIPYVIGATYDRAKQCLPGTRVALLEELTAWANGDDSDTAKVRVLMGAAGTGKSAIAHTLAKRFDATGQLGSMFCFSTSERATRTPASVFRNIARDLCKGRPAFRDALAASIGDDMSACGTNDLEQQFEEFIAKPTKELSLSGTVLLIIEALDESGNDRERARLVSFLMRRLADSLPAGFCVLITCRPEPDIISALRRKPAGLAIREMPTPENEQTLQTDILLYVRYQLSEGSNVLPDDLDEECCRELVKRAEGLFQWAFVACDYIIGQYSFGETERMRYEKLLEGTEEAVSLDDLYITVLRAFTKSKDSIAPFKITMGIVLLAVEPLTMRSLREVMSRIPPDESIRRGVIEQNTILPLLGSLLSGVLQEDKPVRALHSSFREVLCDERRGGQFYIGTVGHHERLAAASLQLLKEGLHFNMGNINTSYRSHQDLVSKADVVKAIPPVLLYSCKFWGVHLSACAADFGGHFGLLQELARELLTKKLLFWMEAGSIGGAVPLLATALSAAINRLRAFDDDIRAISLDAIQFLRRFGPVLVASAPHLYLSALLWSPPDCRLLQVYRSSHQNTPSAASGWASDWQTSELKLSGHTKDVNSVAFSPDGTLIASGSNDMTVRLWDAVTGQIVGSPMTGHTHHITSVAFSPDGTRIVSGSHDDTMRMWNTSTGQLLRDPLVGHTSSVAAVAFSPDGKRIVSASYDTTVRLWDAVTGEQVGEPMAGHRDHILSVAWSPDGSQIISGSDDSMLRVWDAATGKPIGGPVRGNRGAISSVAFSPDGTHFATGCGNNAVRLWDAKTMQRIGEPMTGHTNWAASVVFSHDGKYIISGSHDKTIRIWDVATRSAVGDALTGHSDFIESISLSNDSKRIVSGSQDRTIRVWNADTSPAVRETNHGHEDIVRAVAFSRDGTRVVSGSDDCAVIVWDTATGEMVNPPMTGHKEPVNTVAFSADGKQVVSGSSDSTLQRWNAHTGNKIGGPMKGHEGGVNSVRYSADGRRIVSGGEDQIVRVWSASSGRPMGLPSLANADAITSVAFSQDGTLTMASTADHTLQRWNAKTGQKVGKPMTYDGDGAKTTVFSDDGARMAFGSGDPTIRVWNVSTGELVGQPVYDSDRVRSARKAQAFGSLSDKGWVHPLAFSPDGTKVVSGADDNTVRVWDAATGQQIGKTLNGHTNPVTAVAFSYDGTRVVSGAEDNTVRVWSATPVCASPVSDEVTQKELSERERARAIVYLPSLTLSPELQHQLQQPYETSAADACITLDYETGWILGNGKDLLLWVPPDVARSLYTETMQVVLPGPTIHVDLSRFVHGTRWAECYTPTL